MLIKGRYQDFLRRIGLILIFDSYAWIEFFIGSRLGERVRRYLEEGHEVIVPDIVLAEIARKYWREGFDKKSIGEKLDFIISVSDVVEIDRKVAILVGDSWKELLENAKRQNLKKRPSLADAIILATAKLVKAKVLTGDDHFKGLPEVIFLA